jgi:hypothetical protein
MGATVKKKKLRYVITIKVPDELSKCILSFNSVSSNSPENPDVRQTT